MKRWMIGLMIVLAALWTAALADEEQGSCGAGLGWVLDDSGLLTISGSGPMDDYEWNRSPWFRNENVRRVVMEGVTHVGNYAFYGCHRLTEVSLGEAAESIGGSAFSACRLLSACPFPASLRSIGELAFSDTGFTGMVVPAYVTEVGEGAFTCCRNLPQIAVADGNPSVAAVNGVLFTRDMKTLLCYPSDRPAVSYDVPEGVTRIGGWAFQSCDNLQSIRLPESLTAIGPKAFALSHHFTEIRIPDGVTEIGFAAFNICTALEEVTIPAGVTELAEGLFAYSDGLRRVILHDGITSIGDEVFAGCYQLANLRLPAGLERIGGIAFEGCTALGTLDIPESVESIGEDAFVDSGVRLVCVEGSAGEAYAEAAGLDSVTVYRETLILPEDTEEIGAEAFARLGEHVNIRIPARTVRIADSAFDGSTLLIVCAADSYAAGWAEDHGIPWLDR